MSSVAELFVIPANSLEMLQVASSSQPATYDGLLRSFARVSTTFEFSGYILSTLLPILQTKYGVDLMRDYKAEAEQLSQSSGSLHVLLTRRDDENLSTKLTPARFDSAALEAQFEEFEGDAARGVSEPMLAGVGFLQQGLLNLQAGEVALLLLA